MSYKYQLSALNGFSRANEFGDIHLSDQDMRRTLESLVVPDSQNSANGYPLNLNATKDIQDNILLTPSPIQERDGSSIYSFTDIMKSPTKDITDQCNHDGFIYERHSTRRCKRQNSCMRDKVARRKANSSTKGSYGSNLSANTRLSCRSNFSWNTRSSCRSNLSWNTRSSCRSDFSWNTRSSCRSDLSWEVKAARKQSVVSLCDYRMVTIGGVKTISSSHAHWLHRVFWAALVLFCACVAATWIYDRGCYYFSAPVTVNVNVIRPRQLDFPAVTICNKNLVNVTALKLLWGGFYNSNISYPEMLHTVLGGNGLTSKQVLNLISHDIHHMIQEVREL